MENIIEFLHKVGELKNLKRTGWVRRGIKNPETVAEHSFRCSIIALVLAEKQGLNKDKCVKMALIHDIGECIIGDITPHDNIDEKDKHEREENAVRKLTSKINNNEILELWNEYEERKTKESILVYEIDKIEMLIQAFEYEKISKGQNINLDEFWPYVKERIENKDIIEIYELLFNKRN